MLPPALAPLPLLHDHERSSRDRTQRTSAPALLPTASCLLHERSCSPLSTHSARARACLPAAHSHDTRARVLPPVLATRAHLLARLPRPLTFRSSHIPSLPLPHNHERSSRDRSLRTSARPLVSPIPCPLHKGSSSPLPTPSARAQAPFPHSQPPTPRAGMRVIRETSTAGPQPPPTRLRSVLRSLRSVLRFQPPLRRRPSPAPLLPPPAIIPPPHCRPTRSQPRCVFICLSSRL